MNKLIAEFTQYYKQIDQFEQIRDIAMNRARKSPITEHNQFKRTDQLYDPLRNTLRKSKSKSKLSVSGVSSMTDFHGSVLSNRIHQISPQEAENLERDIYIPIDKALKPTGHLQKIEGRKFIAVDYSQRVNEPISEQNFRKIQTRTGYIQQTVYQFSSKQSSKEQTPVHAYGIIQNQTSDPRRRSAFYSPDQTNFNKNRNSNTHDLLKKKSSKQYQNHGAQSQKQIDFKDIIGEKNVSNQNVHNKDSNNFDQAQQYRFRSGNYATQGNGSVHSSNSQRNKRGLSIAKKKSPYKYNLFSAIDEGVNTKCSSFGKNQIIAKRADNKKWV